MNPHDITKEFEKAICEYTGAPYCATFDNGSNALGTALRYENIKGKEIIIPAHTYPSVPCEIIDAGGIVVFEESPELLKGAYNLKGSRVWDSALRFTADMYIPGTFMCLSFTGQWKTLKTDKGGAILCDSFKADMWFRRYRFSGRRDISYHNDTFDMIGKNYYLPPTLASFGLRAMPGFYNLDGTKKIIPDVEMAYPDLRLGPAYQNKDA